MRVAVAQALLLDKDSTPKCTRVWQRNMLWPRRNLTITGKTTEDNSHANQKLGDMFDFRIGIICGMAKLKHQIVNLEISTDH